MKRILTLGILWAAILCSLSAQTPRFGNIEMAKLFEMMPENLAVEQELARLQAAYDNEIQKMGEDYQLKVSDFVAVQQSLDPNIAEARAQEIEQLQQRIQQFRHKAAQSLRDKRKELTQPIVDRVTRAIQSVGLQYGYTYIFDLKQAGILFFSPEQCDDVMPLVIIELGLN